MDSSVARRRGEERSPTSPQESGAAVPLKETHNSKVDLSPLRCCRTRQKPGCCCDPCGSAVIQLMAAARAGRGLAFFTFRDEKLEHGLRQAYRLLRTKGTTVGECSAQGPTSEAGRQPMMSDLSPLRRATVRPPGGLLRHPANIRHLPAAPV